MPIKSYLGKTFGGSTRPPPLGYPMVNETIGMELKEWSHTPKI